MSETTNEAAESQEVEIIATVLGEKLRLVLPGQGWTVDEARAAKEASGLAPSEIGERLFYEDPDAWLAVLRVSYMRAGESFPADAIGNVNLGDLSRPVVEAMLGADEEIPPTSTSASEPSEPAALEQTA